MKSGMVSPPAGLEQSHCQCGEDDRELAGGEQHSFHDQDLRVGEISRHVDPADRRASRDEPGYAPS
ncbi:hypothetical protein ACFYTS_29195 [Nocardia sp. NPDC004151]|uniref:hypothetical protein n=1 Tax=Nocardia sp. NPDC004151 TaxID=3364304 RepID=UPI00369C6138